MCSACRLAVLTALSGAAFGAQLRVCADPNNLPFSNRQKQGFDNQIASLVAAQMGETVAYYWAAERGEGFVRRTLLSDRCDVLMGVPATLQDAAPTRPYYRSTYVFVSRHDRGVRIRSLNDPAMHKLRIGVHVVSDDVSNLPPAQALANRGLLKNMVAYSIYGDISKPNPPGVLIDAVSRGDVDLAIAWGPLAGYFAKRSQVALDLAPVSPTVDRPFLPFTFSISMAVQPQNHELLASLDRIIERNLMQIQTILRQFGVPMLDAG